MLIIIIKDNSETKKSKILWPAFTGGNSDISNHGVAKKWWEGENYKIASKECSFKSIDMSAVVNAVSSDLSAVTDRFVCTNNDKSAPPCLFDFVFLSTANLQDKAQLFPSKEEEEGKKSDPLVCQNYFLHRPSFNQYFQHIR